MVGFVPLLLFLWVLGACSGPTDAFFEWLKKAGPIPSRPAASAEPTVVPAGAPPFEMSVADEKFLAEGKLMDLSPLDSCHFRVVAQLKATCSGLSEEQLAKLGVALFNCQSDVEGRRTYPCTEEMSIKECTAEMDSDTWNAYHIVSNRARSVCYATRQQHFRRRAELTVNALISTATSQLDAMKDLKEGQQELKAQTAASLDRLMEGHSALQLQQGALREGQEQMDASISSNLQRLAQEKALISTGQELVSQLIQGIAQRMENMSEQLKGQGSEVQEGHQAILDDLTDVRDRAKEIYGKIELNLSSFLAQQNSTTQFHSKLMGQLERMNGTLGYMLLYLDNMQSRLEDRLHMIQGYLGWAGLSLHAVWTCMMHAGYFLLCAVLLSFLQCPTFSRATLLITVPINAIAEVNQQSALDLPTLTLLLFMLSFGRWFVLLLMWALSTLTSQKTRPANNCLPAAAVLSPKQNTSSLNVPASSTPEQNDLDCEAESEPGQESVMSGDPYMVALSPSHAHARVPLRFAHLGLGTPDHSTPRIKHRPSHTEPVIEGILQRNLADMLDIADQSHSSSCNQSIASNSSFSSRPLCRGTTRRGQPCKKRSTLGQDYCRVHEGGHTSHSRL